MPSRATLRLRIWTQFVGRLGFRINLASLHADLSIPTAYLTVIYREKALPSRGRFIISAWASEAAENVIKLSTTALYYDVLEKGNAYALGGSNAR